jgi:hypothetical protein
MLRSRAKRGVSKDGRQSAGTAKLNFRFHCPGAKVMHLFACSPHLRRAGIVARMSDPHVASLMRATLASR